MHKSQTSPYFSGSNTLKISEASKVSRERNLKISRVGATSDLSQADKHIYRAKTSLEDFTPREVKMNGTEVRPLPKHALLYTSLWGIASVGLTALSVLFM